MTWYYHVDADLKTMKVYDHTGSLVKTVENTGNGLTVPDDVLDVMFDVAAQDYTDNGGQLTDYSFRILADAAFEQIEEGTP